jgi:hypothetical protein
MIRRSKFFFKSNYWRGLGIIGAFLEVLAFAFWQSSPRWSGVFAGVGGSILATVIVTWAGPAGEEAYQGFLRLGVTKFYPNRNQVPSEQWVDWLKEAKERCTLLGQAHGEWCSDARFKPTLVERLRAGVKVTVFFLNPNGSGAALRDKEDSLGQRDIKRRIRGSIRTLWDISQSLESPAKECLTIYVYDATPSLGVTWIDGWMVVTHYLAGFLNLTSPALMVESRPDPRCLYNVYQENVNKIRDAKFAIPLTQDNISDYTND